MTEDSKEVTATVDAQATTDRYEVETNIVSEPEVKLKEEPAKEDDSETEPFEEPQESKTINPRTAARKAEKERLLRENAEAKAELAESRAELAKYKQPEPAPKDYSKEPNIQDYEDALAYSRDIAKFEALQAFKQETSKLNQQKQVDAYVERLEVVKADKPDFEEKVGALLNSGLMTSEVESQILSSAMGPEISYHLAEHGGDLMTLRGLPKELLPKAIKQIESFIKQGGQQEKPRVTQAPPPITPPSSTGRTNRSTSSYSQEEIENMPLTEYQRVFMKK